MGIYIVVDALPAGLKQIEAPQPASCCCTRQCPLPLAVAEGRLTRAYAALLVHACGCWPAVRLRALALRAQAVGQSPVSGAQRTLGSCDRFPCFGGGYTPRTPPPGMCNAR